MREVIGNIIHALESGELDLKSYAPNNCTTCIHKDVPLESAPCNSCTTATQKSGRDHKPTDYYSWAPNKVATSQDIKARVDEYGLPDHKHLLQYPPQRCINPACNHLNGPIYKRGLCFGCFKILDAQIKTDAHVAEQWLLMYWLCDSESEREFVIEYYWELNTWDRFEYECKCLPDFSVDSPSRELILYYRVVRTNRSRHPLEDPTPTLKQLKRVMNDEEIKEALKYLNTK